MSRSEPFFRGSEFSRWLSMIGLLVLGLVATWTYLTYQTEHPEPPPPRTVSTDPLPPPDASLELQGVVDKDVLNARETPAYKLLLDRVRSSTPDALASQARRDVVYSQLLQSPARFRGIPIHVEGMVRRCLEQTSSGTGLFPAGRFFEAYVFTVDSQGFPLILSFEQAPPNMPVGDNLNTFITFDGYFLKLLAYKAGDELRFAPLLIGRVTSVPVAPRRESLPWWVPVLAVLVLFGAFRVTVALMTAFKPRRPPTRRLSVSDEIDPDALADWLNSDDDHTPVSNGHSSQSG